MLATSLALADKYNYLEPKFKAAFKWLQEHDVKGMKDGRYDILPGDEAFALVQRYTTMPFAQARFEAHDKYFDIQYLADGRESFGVTLRKDCTLTESAPQNDCYFFAVPKVYSTVNLQAGDFVIVPPEEAHQPRAAYREQTMPVVKVVIKVRV